MSRIETNAASLDQPPSTADQDGAREAEELIELYGVTQVRADYYEWGGFRYTRLEDALNYARRQPRQG